MTGLQLDDLTADKIRAYIEQQEEHKRVIAVGSIARHDDDMPDIKGWTWGQKAVVRRAGSTEADNVRV